MQEHTRTIVSLATATPGWRAIYRRGDEVIARQITAWALVEAGEDQPRTTDHMIGVVIDAGRTAFADAISDGELRFTGYAGPGEDPCLAVEQLDTDAHVDQIARATAKSFASSWFG
ncbi:MAG: hypothetical protein PVF43_07760 [Candidatus Eiseniibacteriota bacterium]|jgi:hypothetical protein